MIFDIFEMFSFLVHFLFLIFNFCIFLGIFFYYYFSFFLLICFEVTNVTTKSYQGYYWTPKMA